eukprot:TRINITY_DN8037_c0_g1_i3.p1 TRINITY_DN8037_c0_g1~~TRINITY_DN8037_c0_g1_i3.p1  ORF type:complete len:509 (+),score=84.32 TRINITY_DN8037_c0_g1_i3:58-1584(+)
MVEVQVTANGHHNGVNGHGTVSEVAPIDEEGVTAALSHASKVGYFPRVVDDADDIDDEGVPAGLIKKPVAVIYDLGVWDFTLQTIHKSFGTGFLHALAVKGTGVAALLKRAVDQGCGLECASIGEVLLAQSVGCPGDKIVFDSPIKTRAELIYALKQGMHLNIDNFEELARIVKIRKSIEKDLPAGGIVGLRINPMVGAGEIAALSVSVADSKFAVPVTLHEKEILRVFTEHPWLNCVHVHVGSGAAGTDMLVAGVKVACELAKRINTHVGKRQVTVLDIGGGLHPDYTNDQLAPFPQYADHLRSEVPDLFTSEDGTKKGYFDRVVTEFGQSISAKTGFIASRLEYVKKFQNGADQRSQIAVSHFGADLCPRQCYTKDHKRRIQFYDADTCSPVETARKEAGSVTTHLAGPLCFQGDFPARDLDVPPLNAGDFAVLREGGSNTLALFSRHCSRMVPPVLGYKLSREDGKPPTVTSLEVLNEPESVEKLCGFWGAQVPPALAAEIAKFT